MVFAAAGGLLTWGSNFADDYVHDELASQNVFSPTRPASATRAGRPRPATPTSRSPPAREAEAYASYIDGHMEGIADGKTYSEIDDRGAAQAVVDAREAGASEAEIAELQATADELKGPARLPVPGRDPAGPAAHQLRLGHDRQIAGIAAWVAFAGAALMAALVHRRLRPPPPHEGVTPPGPGLDRVPGRHRRVAGSPGPATRRGRGRPFKGLRLNLRRVAAGGAREQMIAAAERIAAERGFVAMSLREVQAESGQRNKSAARYHFGSRGPHRGRGRRPHGSRQPARAEMLAAYDARPGEPSLRDLVAGLVAPLAEHTVARSGSHWARFLAQGMADPVLSAVVQRRLEVRSYRDLRDRMTAALGHVPVRLRVLLASTTCSA